MNETNQRQILFISSVDFACIGTCPGTDGEGLDGAAVLSGPDGWSRLLKAAELQENDDRGCDGYLLKAWAIDPTTGTEIDCRWWTDLCSDQVERIWRCFAVSAQRESPWS